MVGPQVKRRRYLSARRSFAVLGALVDEGANQAAAVKVRLGSDLGVLGLGFIIHCFADLDFESSNSSLINSRNSDGVISESLRSVSSPAPHIGQVLSVVLSVPGLNIKCSRQSMFRHFKNLVIGAQFKSLH